MSDTWIPLLHTDLAVRRTLLDEAQAIVNHGQTLAQLASRGGVSPSEALALVEKRAWQQVDEAAALVAIFERLPRRRNG